MAESLPQVLLGSTGQTVTRLGLGGEGVLRTFDREADAVPLIQRALQLGITYYDCARAYSGSEQYYGLALGQQRKNVFLCSKTHDRTKKGSRVFLETTLRSMKTDHLDLWQFHDIRTQEDLDRASAVGGCMQAFDDAKKAGYVRFIGITGHYNPEIIIKGMSLFHFDTVLMPVNPSEPHHLSFLDSVIPEARKRKMGIIGMKSIKPYYAWNGKAFKIPELINFALSQDIDVLITGCDTIGQLEENVSVANNFSPLSPDECRDMIERGKNAKNALFYKMGIG